MAIYQNIENIKGEPESRGRAFSLPPACPLGDPCKIFLLLYSDPKKVSNRLSNCGNERIFFDKVGRQTT